MRILKFLSCILICVLCVFSSYAAEEEQGLIEEVATEEIVEQSNWLDAQNFNAFNHDLSQDIDKFQNNFQTSVRSKDFVPIEVKLGLAFMKALSALDYVLQISFIRFVIALLILAYALWVGFEAYKMIRESTDYKTVFYEIIKKGAIIVAWVAVLEIGPSKIFTALITPIISVGVYLSDFILNTVAETYNVEIPDTCTAIHNYVAANNTGKLLIDSDSAANIMCVPARLSVYFYHATASAFKWMIYGFGHSAVMVIVGGYCVYMFIKCIFKYAFMTLGIVADLFLKILLLPFTALAEAMPSISDTNYAAKMFNSFIGIFKAQKLSGVIEAFINAAIYFVSLSIVIAICAALLNNIISITSDNTYTVPSAITTILCGSLILYLANKTDEIVEKLGGKIDNSFGEKVQEDAKNLYSYIKSMGGKLSKAVLKKKIS